MQRLTCPKCGWDAQEEGAFDYSFRHLEDVAHERRVVGFNTAGALEIEGEERIQLDDPGINGRLQCGDCLAEFAIPRT